MPREIKFRAWILSAERMGTVTMLSLNDGSGRVQFPGDDGWFFSKEANDVELMQFTGLKDKNGKEIYEGDILEHRDAWYPEVNSPMRVWVEYILEPFGGYCAVDRGGVLKLVARLFDDDGYETTVIGNVHENTELLKEPVCQ